MFLRDDFLDVVIKKEDSLAYLFIDPLAKWLNVPLRANCLWVRVPLQPLKLQILRLFRAERSLLFRQL